MEYDDDYFAEFENVRAGDYLVRINDDYNWWTLGKAYKVQVNANNSLFITSNDGRTYFLDREDDAWSIRGCFRHDPCAKQPEPQVETPCCPVANPCPKHVQDNIFKDTNPKDAVGTKKAPLSTVSGPVIMELGVAMLEGARKYGRHNYRISNVRASVYYDAAMRHLISWFEGEDIDPDSGMSHIIKAIASLAVLRDAQINDCLVDDRPPSSKVGWKDKIQENVDDIFKRYPEAKSAHTIAESKG